MGRKYLSSHLELKAFSLSQALDLFVFLFYPVGFRDY